MPGRLIKLCRFIFVLFALAFSGCAAVLSSGAAVSLRGAEVSSDGVAVLPGSVSGVGGSTWVADDRQSQLSPGSVVRLERGSDSDETVNELDLGEEQAFLPSGHDYIALENQGFDLRWGHEGEAPSRGFRSRSVLVRLHVLRPFARAPPLV